MKKIIFIVIAFFVTTCSYAQHVNKDSLQNLLRTAKDDTTKIKLLLKIQKSFSTANFDSSLYYLTEAQKLLPKLHNNKFEFMVNTGFSEYYYYNNDYKKALQYSLDNLKISEKNKDDMLAAKTYNNLAAISNHFGNYKSGVDYILKCLELSEKTNDSASFAIRNLTASHTYYNLKQFDKTIYYSKKAIEYGKKFGNIFAVTMGYNNLASAFSEIHMTDSAIYFSIRQLEISQKEGDIVNIVQAATNLVFTYFSIGDVQAVVKYAALLEKHMDEMPDSRLIAEARTAIAMKFILLKNYPAAKAGLDSGISLALKEDDMDGLGNQYRTYATLYFIQNKIKDAHDYLYKYDSLIAAGNLKELNFYTEDIETKYQTEKKEAQIQLQNVELKQKTFLNYFLLGGAATLLLLIFLGYRNYNQKQRIQQARITELETEKQLTATEAVLKGEEQERTRLAKDLHDGLGGMLSGIKYSLSNMKGNLIMTPDNAQAFERSMDMLDSSIKEMRRVAHNMMPEVLVKYGLDIALKEYCNEINNSGVIHTSYHSIDLANAHIEQTIAVTVYRIVQELVNNSIKHAAAKNVLVQAHVTEAGKLLTVTVEDDGKGFDPAELKHASGIGWSNIQNRVDFLKGKIDMQTGEGKGTSVLIEVNV